MVVTTAKESTRTAVCRAGPDARAERRTLTTVSVVVPALDEEANLRGLLPRLRRVLADLPDFAFEILVVDDGSRDGTAAVARAFGARLVRHPERLGNGAAVKRGIRESHGDWVLLMDAERGEIHDAPPFPGVQIALRLPRHVFGIDEPPVDNGSFSEFNELHG